MVGFNILYPITVEVIYADRTREIFKQNGFESDEELLMRLQLRANSKGKEIYRVDQYYHDLSLGTGMCHHLWERPE